jgi:hypothetical protein
VLFIENSHEHVHKITCALTGHAPPALGDVQQRTYDLALEAIEAN